MALFAWFASSRRPATVPRVMPPASLPPGAPMAGSAESDIWRRAQRHARREQLHRVVRDDLVGSGVLSSAFKFKVLALDAAGHQFLVMVDLADPQGSHTTRLASIEARIAHSAKARHEIVVAAVYWRICQQITLGTPAEGLTPGALAAAPPVAGGAADPLSADEVAAFQRALNRGATTTSTNTSTAAAAAPAARDARTLPVLADRMQDADPPSAWPATVPNVRPRGVQSGMPVAPGYEDTEIEDDVDTGALGRTQYGALN